MPRSRLALWLLIGLLARSVVLTLPGTSDVWTWKTWSLGAARDLTGVYGVGGSPPERKAMHWERITAPTDYPPLSLVSCAFVGRIYLAIDPQFRDGPVLTALIKLPGLAFEALFVWVLLAAGRRLLGDRAAEWAALAYWLNPGVWLSGAVLGYIDAPMAVPAALSVLALAANRFTLAGALAAMAVLTKPQPLFLLPILAVLALGAARPRRWRALGSAAAGAVLVATVVVGPYVLRGALPNLLQAVSRLFQHDMMSAFAPNIWWIATWLIRVTHAIPDIGWHDALRLKIDILGITRAVELGYPSARAIGTGLVLAALAWAGWRASRVATRAGAAALCAWTVYAYTVLGSQVHENHLYLALPILALAAGEIKSLRPAYWAMSGIFALNLYLFYGLGNSLPPVIDRRWTIVDMTVLLAVVNVAVFLWFTRRVFAVVATPR